MKFIVIFGLVAFFYAVLSAFTKFFYRGKDHTELSLNEMSILDDRASIVVRVKVFVINFFSSILFPPIYIISGIITGAIYLFT